MPQNYADGTANSEDPDQTASLGGSSIWVFPVCRDLYVENLG